RRRGRVRVAGGPPGPRLRRRGDGRPGPPAARAGWLSQPASEDPRYSPGPDRHGRGDHRRDRRERDAVVLRQPLPAHRRRIHTCPAAPPRRRARPGGAVGGLGVYLPLGFSRRPVAAPGAPWPARLGDGTEDVLLPSAAAVRQALAGTRRGWR